MLRTSRPKGTEVEIREQIATIPGASRLSAEFAAARVARLRSRRRIDPQHRKLNFGAGVWFAPDWEVVDLYIRPKLADYRYDLQGKPTLPLPDACCDIIFTSHTLEHVSDAAAQHFMGEALRLLHPGAVLRVAVPDADKAIAAYRAGDIDFFTRGGVNCRGNREQMLVNYFSSYRINGIDATPEVSSEEVVKSLEEMTTEEFIDYCRSRQPDDVSYTGHVNGYTGPKLVAMLEEAGFSNAQISYFRGSRVPELRGEAFDNRPTVSLFVEGTA